jgi:hypothetical protein
MRIWRVAAAGTMAVCLWAQPAQDSGRDLEQPDAERTRESLSQLLEHYPPSVRGVLALDPSLMSNPAYMAPYPALTTFLNSHPDVARNPTYYVGRYADSRFQMTHATQVAEMWQRMLGDLSVFAGFGMAIALLVWLIRTLIDYRRWQKLSKVQTEVHTKLLDRFTSNEDLLAYVQSPAGKKFLQSAPIALDAGPRSMGAPLGRILWSLQAGLVVLAAGVGMQVAAGQVSDEGAQPLHVLGIMGMAVGIGFAVSAFVSFLISQRLGLIEPAAVRPDPGAEG